MRNFNGKGVSCEGGGGSYSLEIFCSPVARELCQEFDPFSLAVTTHDSSGLFIQLRNGGREIDVIQPISYRAYSTPELLNNNTHPIEMVAFQQQELFGKQVMPSACRLLIDRCNCINRVGVLDIFSEWNVA